MKTVKKGRQPRKENRHVVQIGLLATSAGYCRIPGLLQVETLLLQSSSRVQLPLTQSCIHMVARTRFRMQIIVCSICHASVGAYDALVVIIVVVFDEFFLPCSFIEQLGTKGRRRFIPTKLNRTANSLISISNDGPNNHTYKNLCLNELAKFPRHHRCFYELWESHSD